MCDEELLPDIEAKWPTWCPKDVNVQQDGATPHPEPGKDPILEAALNKMRAKGWTIKFTTQPPNSPDVNIQDLAQLRGIQSI